MNRREDAKDEKITNWIIGFGILFAVIWMFDSYNFVEMYRQLVKIFIME
jgi:hypothetical protein